MRCNIYIVDTIYYVLCCLLEHHICTICIYPASRARSHAQPWSALDPPPVLPPRLPRQLEERLRVVLLRRPLPLRLGAPGVVLPAPGVVLLPARPAATAVIVAAAATTRMTNNSRVRV